jgi:Sulfotransferase family
LARGPKQLEALWQLFTGGRVMIEQKTIEKLPPIFVVGAPRSGTTLTRRILDRHSRVFMPGETHFFDDIYSRRRELGDLSDAESIRKVLARLRTLYRRYDEHPDQQRIDALLQRCGVIEKLMTCRTYPALLSRFMEIQMRAVGKVRWGNNVPKDIFHIDDILTFYPDAKFLVCIRDVKDFVLSYKNKWKNTGAENADRIKRLYHPVVTSLLWKASVKQILRMKDLIPSENLMMIRYESLVQNPERLVREICQFIGENFEADMVNVDEENSSFQVGEKGIYSSSVGRWRTLLANEEVYIAQTIGGHGLPDLGYSIGKFKTNHFKVGCIYATLPYALWKAFRANRAIRGPLLPYVGRRLGALWHAPRRRGNPWLCREIDTSPLRNSR